MTLPVLEATVCYLRKNGMTLFIDYRNFPHPLHQGYFSPPGGKLEIEETKEQAVIREVLEETHIKINSLIYRGKVLFSNEKRLFGGKPAKNSYLVHYFDSLDFDDNLAQATEGALAWTLEEEINNLPMRKGDRQIWKWLKIYKEIEAEIVEDEKGSINAYLIGFKNQDF